MTNDHKVIISGSHMDLTDVLKQTINQKVQRLFNHKEQIVKIRVDLGYDHKKDSKEEFAAKGHVHLNGPNFNNSPDNVDLDGVLDKMVDKHHKKVQKAQFVAKGHIELRGNDLHASESSEDLYKSIDKMVDKLERMLHERSDIQKTKRNHPHDVDIPTNIPKTKS